MWLGAFERRLLVGVQTTPFGSCLNDILELRLFHVKCLKSLEWSLLQSSILLLLGNKLLLFLLFLCYNDTSVPTLATARPLVVAGVVARARW